MTFRTCFGKREPHAAPELITTLLLDPTRHDPAIAADYGAVVALKRLFVRDQGVIHKVDRLLARYCEKPELIAKLNGPVGRLIQIFGSCKLRLVSGMRICRDSGGGEREVIDLARRNAGAVKSFMIDTLRTRELAILSKRCAVQIGDFAFMEEDIEANGGGPRGKWG